MLKSLFKKDSSSDSTSDSSDVPELPAALRKAILAVVGANSIATMSSSAQKAFEVSTDPESQARDFIEVIESDEALAARIIKVANSVYFDRGHGSTTIEESVVTIGTEELRGLLSATSLSEIFPTNHPARAMIWKHDVAVGIVSKNLVERFLPAKKESAFLAGLMHDVGKLLLLQRVTADYEQVLQQVRQGEEFTAAEQSRFPFDHTEAGHVIAERWNFTPELIQVIRCHHLSWEELQSRDLPLVAVVKASDLIVHTLGIGFEPDFTRFSNKTRLSLDEVWQYLSIPSSEGRKLLENARRAIDQEYELYQE